MRIYIVLLALCGATLTGVIAAVLIHAKQQGVTGTKQETAGSEQVFQVNGEVRGLDVAESTVRIAHEDIPGFMPAMEMPLTVKDLSLLRGLKAGDAVRFELRVTKDDSWVSVIHKIERRESNPTRDGQDAKQVSENKNADVLAIGEAVPDFTLVDQDGKRFHLRDFRGQAVVVTFIYTRCPLPNFCPLMSRNFASLQERFSKNFPRKARLVSNSFDPQFDTPQVLQGYSHLYDADAKVWTFATGTPQEIDRVTGAFGLIRESANGLINHDLRTALISPEGKLVHIWRSNVWTPFEVQRMVQETLQPTLAASR